MADNRTEQIDFERVWASVEKTAHLLIHKFKVYGFEYEDLLQEGRIECWKALQDFDDSQGVKFNTYFFVRFKNRLRTLYQLASRKKEYYNQHRNSKLTDDLISAMIRSDTKDPLHEAMHQEQLEILQSNIKLLPKKIQRILELKSQGFEVSQIARKVTLSKMAIYNILNNTKEVLQTSDPKKVKAYSEQYTAGQKSYIKALNKKYKIKDPNQ
jgi:RNA polymerase sigma factor (sigma-70 family)